MHPSGEEEIIHLLARWARQVSMRLAVIIPALDEESSIEGAVSSAAAADCVLVVDGGSKDRTVERAQAAGARVISSKRGRGRQLSLGAAQADGDVLLFLHADTRLPRNFRSELERLAADGVAWGRFDVRFDRGGPLLRLIARLISLRSRWTQVATGDQAIFVVREVFDRVGGFRESLLFEDIDLCRRLKRVGRMGIPASPVVTSSRRWRQGGTLRTTLLMWTLKSLYLCGVPAERLARFYRERR